MDIIDVEIRNERDHTPMQMISGARLAHLHAVEKAALQLIANDPHNPAYAYLKSFYQPAPKEPPCLPPLP